MIAFRFSLALNPMFRRSLELLLSFAVFRRVLNLLLLASVYVEAEARLPERCAESLADTVTEPDAEAAARSETVVSHGMSDSDRWVTWKPAESFEGFFL